MTILQEFLQRNPAWRKSTSRNRLFLPCQTRTSSSWSCRLVRRQRGHFTLRTYLSERLSPSLRRYRITTSNIHFIALSIEALEREVALAEHRTACTDDPLRNQSLATGCFPAQPGGSKEPKHEMQAFMHRHPAWKKIDEPETRVFRLLDPP